MKTSDYYRNAYNILKSSLIEEVKLRVNTLTVKFTSDELHYLLNDEFSIFIDEPSIEDEEDFNYHRRFISNIDSSGVDLSNNCWGEVGGMDYEELSFETLIDLNIKLTEIMEKL